MSDAKKIIEAIQAELNTFGDLYWSFNLPLQMWPGDDGWRVINYMPRKEAVDSLDQRVTKEQLPTFCFRASAILRNLADQFDALGSGRIDYIYYPDTNVDEKIAEFEEDKKELAP